MRAAEIYGGSVYVDMLVKQGKLDEARKRIDVYKEKSGLFDEKGNISERRISYWFYIGLYHLKNNQLDSAEFCFRKMTGHKQCHLEESFGLLSVYRQKKNVDSIIKYVNDYAEATDEQSYSRQTETVHQMSAIYNYNRFQHEALKTRLKAAHAQTISGMLILFLLLTILCITYLYWKNREKEREAQKNYRDNLKKLEQAQTELILLRQLEQEDDSNEFAESLEVKTTLFQAQQYKKVIEEKKEQIALLEKKINNYQTHIGDTNMVTEKQLKEWGVYQHFHELADVGVSPTPEDWRELRMGIIDLLPGFHLFLSSNEYMLNLNEYNTCILIRLHIKPTAIANMLGVTGAYITKIRTGMVKRLFHEEGTSSDFDKRIQELF